MRALSARELSVLTQICRGHEIGEVAAALDIMPRTVQGHLQSIFAKLGARNRIEAYNTAMALGLIEPPSRAGRVSDARNGT